VALLAMACWSTSAFARPFDAERPWYVEGSIGAVRRGPDGTDFGSGQNYAAHLGFQMTPWTDLGLSLAWAHARSTTQAIESNVTSGGLRARGWVGSGRWSPYAELGMRLYRFDLQQSSVIDPLSDQSLKFGGHVGVGVLYARSTWWGGLGAELHGAIGSVSIEGGDLLTFTTYNVFVGGPMSW
jgi:hypothetical protein